MDALLGNKNVVMVVTSSKITSPFTSEEEACERDSEYKFDMYEKAKEVFEDMAIRGIISHKKKNSILGQYWNWSYINAKQIIKEYTLYKLCCSWSEIGEFAVDELKYKHYYKDRGLSKTIFHAFCGELRHSTTGVAAAAVLLKYKGLLAIKKSKNDNALNRVRLNVNARKKVKIKEL